MCNYLALKAEVVRFKKRSSFKDRLRDPDPKGHLQLRGVATLMWILNAIAISTVAKQTRLEKHRLRQMGGNDHNDHNDDDHHDDDHDKVNNKVGEVDTDRLFPQHALSLSSLLGFCFCELLATKVLDRCGGDRIPQKTSRRENMRKKGTHEMDEERTDDELSGSSFR